MVYSGYNDGPQCYRVNSIYDSNRSSRPAVVGSLLVQPASSTTDIMAEPIREEQESSTTTSTNITTTNNSSNAVLGSLFLTGEDTLTNFNRINETYTELSYSGNRTIMPIEGVTTAIINATETGNLTFNL